MGGRKERRSRSVTASPHASCIAAAIGRSSTSAAPIFASGYVCVVKSQPWYFLFRHQDIAKMVARCSRPFLSLYKAVPPSATVVVRPVSRRPDDAVSLSSTTRTNTAPISAAPAASTPTRQQQQQQQRLRAPSPSYRMLASSPSAAGGAAARTSFRPQQQKRYATPTRASAAKSSPVRPQGGDSCSMMNIAAASLGIEIRNFTHISPLQLLSLPTIQT